jgi:Domain of unknown function (DUF3883)/EVE domain
MQQPQQHYWAFCINPNFYRIEKAIRELPVNSQTVPRRNVRAGDRAIIWKAKGTDRHRGIVALAEVLTDPKPSIDPNEGYWVNQNTINEVVDRVIVRYFIPPALPLWEDATDLPFLKELSVARSTGGTVFHVTPDQWDAIIEAVGGWPVRNPEIEDAELTIAEYAGKRHSGQGYSTNPDIRRAIELYAMQKATAFYEEQGWIVSDVSLTHSYDLLCTSITGEELHIEVKGTTSDGTKIFLTANEVIHAQNHYPRVALFILSNIQVDPKSIDKPQSGEIQRLEPWKVDDGTLSALAFSYTLPKGNT